MAATAIGPLALADLLGRRQLRLNERLQMDGLKLLASVPENLVPIVFFDPQYRGVLDKLKYGNEGKSRGRARCELKQMTGPEISRFIAAIDRVLKPSGHLFLWMDKFHLCSGFADWFRATSLAVVDMVVWHKERIGMGYRTRRVSEHVVILQKEPRRAKRIWKVHSIPDVWKEKVERGAHAHRKPVRLQEALIEAVSEKGDIVLDPAAGSFSVLTACRNCNRNFLGCDLKA